MNKLRHLEPKVAEILSRTDDERIGYIFKDKWIAYPIVKELLREIEILLEVPDKQRKKFLLIEGRSGNGKTTLLKHFYEQHLPYRSCGTLICPVMFIEGPSGPSVEEFYSNILEELGSPTASKRTKMMLQLKKILPQVQAKILLVDNFHDFQYGNADLKRKFLASVRKLCTETELSIVATGTFIARNVINRDAQMHSRFTFRSLPAWKYNNDYLNLLAAFERILPLRKKSCLTDEKLAFRIFKMSEGVLANLEEILQEAAQLAIETGKERIDEDILKDIPFNRKHDPQPVEKDEYAEG